jgi:hypothetical protein
LLEQAICTACSDRANQFIIDKGEKFANTMSKWFDEPPPTEDLEHPGTPCAAWSFMVKNFQQHERREDHKKAFKNLHPELARSSLVSIPEHGPASPSDSADLAPSAGYSPEEIEDMREKGMIVIAYVIHSNSLHLRVHVYGLMS